MEMSYNARVLKREALKKNIEQFHGDHDQTSHGNRGPGVLKRDSESFIDRLRAKKESLKEDMRLAQIENDKSLRPGRAVSNYGKYRSKEELEANEGMSKRTFIETSGRIWAEKAPADHGMTKREYIEARSLGGADTAQNDHPMTVREFIEATGRGGAKDAPNDHPMTMKEFVEYSGRGGSKSGDLRKNAPNDHPMTEEEYRKAMGLTKKK